MKARTHIFVLSLLFIVTFTGCEQDTVNNSATPYLPKYKIYGLCFSPYNDGQNPNINSQISVEQISNLLTKAAPYTNWIRTYGCTDGLEKIPEKAHSLGLKVAAGAWLSGNSSSNQIQISKLVELGQAGHIDIAIVGSETILRRDLTPSQLIAYINQVKTALPNIPVTTADVYQTFLAHPEIRNAVDIIVAHVYPYWEGVSIDCAAYFVNTKYESLAAVSQGKEIIIGETGWPSAGNSFGSAVPSGTNASGYFINFVSWAKAKNVKYMYFETYDEQWKAAVEGPQGAHWGIFYKNGGDLKPGMKRVFDGETVPGN